MSNAFDLSLELHFITSCLGIKVVPGKRTYEDKKIASIFSTQSKLIIGKVFKSSC